MVGGETDPGGRSAGARFLERALWIDAIDPRSAGELSFMPRFVVQAPLHNRPELHEFERENTQYSRRLTAPSSVGLRHAPHNMAPG